MPPCGGPFAITNKARGTVGNTAFMQLDLKETIWMLYCMCWKINPSIQKETRSTSWCHFNERQPCLVFHSVSVCWHVASTSTLVHMSAIHAVSNAVQLSNAQKRINDRLMKFKQLHPVNCATRSALFRKHTLDVFCHNYTVSVKLSCQLLQAISFLEHQKIEFLEIKACSVLDQHFILIAICYLQCSNMWHLVIIAAVGYIYELELN